MTDKITLRRHYSALRDGLAPKARTAAEAVIRERLCSLSAWKEATLVCGYASMQSELDLSQIRQTAIGQGKSYALPVTVTDAREGRMVFRRLTEFAPDRLIPARFGVKEPSSDCPTLTLRDFQNEKVLIIVPGLVFDDSGYRIGYGGGYYDRFLASLAEAGIAATTVGLAFSVCRTPILPHDPFDIPVDLIIDERRLMSAHGSI